MQDVLSVEEAEEDQEALSALVYDALDAALASLAQMRATEGAALQADVMARLERLETLSQEMDARAPEWLAEYRESCARV